MPIEFTFDEYYRGTRRHYCRISETKIEEMKQQAIENGDSLDDFVDSVKDYIKEDSPWDWSTDEEAINEEYDDIEYDFDELEQYIYDEYKEIFDGEEELEEEILLGEI